MVGPHRISLSRDARADLRRAYDYYEGEQSDLGKRFVRHFVDALEAIAERPRSFPVVHRRVVRRAIISRFPYGVFFRPVQDDAYEIFAVIDLRRHPRHWRGRA